MNYPQILRTSFVLILVEAYDPLLRGGNISKKCLFPLRTFDLSGRAFKEGRTVVITGLGCGTIIGVLDFEGVGVRADITSSNIIIYKYLFTCPT